VNEVQWLLVHSEATRAGPAFVWRYMTDVTHWVDPPASFRLDGPFETGSPGMTMLPEREPVRWVIHEVVAGASYTIASELEGATLLWEWRFDPVPVGGTRLTQRIGLIGSDAAGHAESIRDSFGPGLAPGMRRVASLLAAAETRE
jgi:hypothetical protein